MREVCLLLSFSKLFSACPLKQLSCSRSDVSDLIWADRVARSLSSQFSSPFSLMAVWISWACLEMHCWKRLTWPELASLPGAGGALPVGQGGFGNSSECGGHSPSIA